jgi:hypothetical protein
MKRQRILLARMMTIGILLLFITPTLFAELLNDGSFENRPSDWEEYYNTTCNAVSIGNWVSAGGPPAVDGQQTFWAGGACGDGVVANNGARQEITFQPDAALLSFWYFPFKAAPDPNSNDLAIVAFDDIPIWELNVDGITSPTGWNNAIINIEQFADQTNTLSIEMQQNSDSAIAHVFFDYIEVFHPAIEVSQVISPAAMLLNSDFSVEISVENSGDTFLNNISVSNTVFSDCDREVGTLPDLDLGESVTYICDVTNATVNMENTAVASATTTEIEFVVEASNVASPVIINPLLSLTVDPESISVEEGETITFILTLTNNGNSTLTNVQIASPQVTGCNLALGSLGASETAVFNCTYTPRNSETITFDATAMEPATNTEVSTETAVFIEILPIVPPSIPIFTQFIPLVVNNFINHNALGEPNNSCAAAFPISINQSANFLAEDINDWYGFTLNSPSDLTVNLTDFIPIAGQITLWRGTCNSLTLIGQNGDFSTEKSINVSNQPAGTYYIWLISDGPINFTNLYELSIETP